jgi:hypothetical protein
MRIFIVEVRFVVDEPKGSGFLVKILNSTDCILRKNIESVPCRSNLSVQVNVQRNLAATRMDRLYRITHVFLLE